MKSKVFVLLRGSIAKGDTTIMRHFWLFKDSARTQQNNLYPQFPDIPRSAPFWRRFRVFNVLKSHVAQARYMSSSLYDDLCIVT